MNNFKRYRLILFGLVGTLYFLVCLHRVSPTVIARDLALAFNADAVLLGIAASSYFYLYSVVQPVVGYLSDTAGPRRIITISFLLAAVGAVIFGTASNSYVLIAGRILVGAGAGGVFIPALKIFSKWYRLDEFAMLTGLLLTTGGLGALSAALPLTYLVLWVGWRASFVWIGALSFLLAIICWVVIRDKPEDRGWPPVPTLGPSAGESHGAGMRLRERLGHVLGNADFQIISLSSFFTGGAMTTFQGLWAVPYLMDVFKLGRVPAGTVLMLLPLGFAVGGPMMGYLTDRLHLNRKKALLAALAFSLIGWLVLVFLEDRAWFFLVPVYFFIFGLVGGGSLTILFTVNRNLFSSELTGTSSGLMNMAAFLGTAIYQPFTGYLLERFSAGEPGIYSLEAYQALMTVFLASYVVAVLATSRLSGD